MRIPKGVDVAFGASHLAGGDFEDLGEARGVKIAGCADLDFRISGLVMSGGSQPISSSRPTNDEQIGSATA